VEKAAPNNTRIANLTEDRAENNKKQRMAFLKDPPTRGAQDVCIKG